MTVSSPNTFLALTTIMRNVAVSQRLATPLSGGPTSPGNGSRRSASISWHDRQLPRRRSTTTFSPSFGSPGSSVSGAGMAATPPVTTTLKGTSGGTAWPEAEETTTAARPTATKRMLFIRRCPLHYGSLYHATYNG